MTPGRIEALFTIPTGGAAMSVTTNAGGPTTVTVAAGTYYISTLITALQAALIAQRSISGGSWVVSLSTTTGRVTIQATNGTWSLSWTSTALRDVLGFTGNLAGVTGAQTGADQARGLWFPDCPLNLSGDPSMAPKATDLIATEGPTGNVVGHVSNVKYRHRQLRYTAVPLARVREGASALINASWETFLNDTQHGLGHSWFGPCSKVHIYTHDGTQVGEDVGVTGWFMKGLGAIDDCAKQIEDGWTQLWRIDIPEITTSG